MNSCYSRAAFMRGCIIYKMREGITMKKVSAFIMFSLRSFYICLGIFFLAATLEFCFSRIIYGSYRTPDPDYVILMDTFTLICVYIFMRIKPKMHKIFTFPIGFILLQLLFFILALFMSFSDMILWTFSYTLPCSILSVPIVYSVRYFSKKKSEKHNNSE